MRQMILATLTALVGLAGLAAPAAAYGDPQGYGYGQRGPRFDQKVEVLWGSSWWPATILQASGGQYLIHYDGYASSWDEWVGADRIRNAAGIVNRWGDSMQVSIQWGGSWYPGRVMKIEGGRYLVTYDGWSSTFDEWVGAERLRFVEATPSFPVRPVHEIHHVEPVRRDPPRKWRQNVRPGRQEWPARGPDWR
ncbi:MAG: hypothetical protein IT385_30075 [Deltaproteobacteria bacterium]|nr:hypothetical protein [Deltaproteobacteria bacterium]